MSVNTPRFDLAVAADVRVVFAKRDDNNTFQVDTWGVRVEDTGEVFSMNILGYYDPKPGSVPMFGSAKSAKGPVWGFKDDVRVKAGFTGQAVIMPHSGTTYVVFRSKGSKAAVHHVVSLCDLLMQQSPSMTPAESGRIKVAIAKALGINAVLTKDEDDAVSYSVRVIYTDPADKARLEKVANVHTNRATYRVVDASGNLRHGPFHTLAEGQLAIGHVPEAPKTAPGGKTNVGGEGHVKGKSGDGGQGNKSKQPKGGKGNKKAA